MRASLTDLLIPTAVLAVVGMMIFPLPSVLLDLLLMCNMTFALALLISTVFLAEPEKFTTLPTILLLSTLFRLGLNISTTRGILGHGSAPEVVQAFGQFVAGGNLVVGAVIFIIITIVQFLVIAKGAERVAEVAARFTLDAMPGKQMAIDADVRAGALGLLEAKERRIELQREAKLYGALDGAMKFVKGDSIAGLLITAVNITAGLLVGMSQLGLSAGEAVQRFTILTIGDGLVSQIPALLIAVGAGIAVTRVSDKSESLMGREVLSQLTQEPKTASITGCALIGLGLVPGLPTAMFGVSGALLLFFGWCLSNEDRRSRTAEAESEFRPAVASPLVLKLSPRLGLVLHREGAFPALVQQRRRELFNRRGVLVPDMQFEIEHSEPDSYGGKLQLNGRLIAQVAAAEDGCSAENESRRVAALLMEGIEAHLSEVVNDTQTRSLLDLHSAAAEDLVHSVVPELASVTEITLVLRQLVREGVSIREMPAILQAAAEHYMQNGEPDRAGIGSQNRLSLLEEVRIKLGPTICQMLRSGEGPLEVVSCDAALEQLAAQAAMSSVPLSPKIHDSIRESAARQFTEPAELGPKVVLTSKEARLLLYEVLVPEIADIHVLACEELDASTPVKVKGQIILEQVSGVSDAEALPQNVVGLERAAA